MGTVRFDNRNDLESALAWIAPGDCVELDSLDLFADKGKEMLTALAAIGERGADFVSLKEGIDTRRGQGQSFFALCRALSNSELFARRRVGVERAKAEGRYKGRKPIQHPEFDTVVAQWRKGKITAAEAMRRLGMSSSTFYRKARTRSPL